MANARKVEGFRLCLLHLVGQLQDGRKLLDHASRRRWPSANKERFRAKVEGFRLLAGDKLSQKRDIKQALNLSAELGKE